MRRDPGQRDLGIQTHLLSSPCSCCRQARPLPPSQCLIPALLIANSSRVIYAESAPTWPAWHTPPARGSLRCFLGPSADCGPALRGALCSVVDVLLTVLIPFVIIAALALVTSASPRHRSPASPNHHTSITHFSALPGHRRVTILERRPLLADRRSGLETHIKITIPGCSRSLAWTISRGGWREEVVFLTPRLSNR